MADEKPGADTPSNVDMKSHWETVYRSKSPDEVSWHQDQPHVSLELIEGTGLSRTSGIIDIGGGASRLVDFLLASGYGDLTVLDISAAALEHARGRLGAAGAGVRWIEADVTRFSPDRTWLLWHDRAAFHFLTGDDDRRRYVEVLERALARDGQAIIATFAPDGPKRCSGLDIVRYDARSLSGALGRNFKLIESRTETHLTPQGREQRFGFHLFARRP